MAALNMFEAAKISRNPLTRGIMLGIATTNELFGIFPWVQKVGNAWQYDREKALPTVEFVSPAHTSLTESSGTFDQVTAQMRLIASDVDVYNHTQNQNDPNGDPRAIQLAMKLKKLGMELQTKMFTGSYVTGFTLSAQPASWTGPGVDAAVPSAHTDSDRLGPGSLKYTNTGTFWQYRAPGDRTYGPQVAIAADGSATLVSDNPNKKLLVTIDVSDAAADAEIHIYFTSTTHEIDGVNKLIPSSQVVPSSGANGDALSFDVMDRLLYEKVKVKSDLYFVMNSSLKRKFMALVRSSSGGMTPEQLSLPILGMDGQPAQMRVPQYNGIPILQVDDIPSNESKGGASTLSSLYLVSLTPELGLYGGVQAVGREVMADLDPFRARIMGVKLYDFPQLEDKAAQRTRVEWFGAIALGSELAAARASELVTA